MKRKKKKGKKTKHSKPSKPVAAVAKENETKSASDDKTPRISNRRDDKSTVTTTPGMLRPKPSDSSSKHLRRLKESMEARRSNQGNNAEDDSSLSLLPIPHTNARESQFLESSIAQGKRRALEKSAATAPAGKQRANTKDDDKDEPRSNRKAAKKQKESPPDQLMDCTPDDVSLSLEDIESSPEKDTLYVSKKSDFDSKHPVVTKGMLQRARTSEVDNKAAIEAMLRSVPVPHRKPVVEIVETEEEQHPSLVGTTVQTNQDCSASLDGSEVTMLTDPGVSNERPKNVRPEPRQTTVRGKSMGALHAAKQARAPSTHHEDSNNLESSIPPPGNLPTPGVVPANDGFHPKFATTAPHLGSGVLQSREPSLSGEEYFVYYVNGKPKKHPLLPSGWKLHYSKSKEKVYYTHPDFSTTWHCPVVFPESMKEEEVELQPGQTDPAPPLDPMVAPAEKPTTSACEANQPVNQVPIPSFYQDTESTMSRSRSHSAHSQPTVVHQNLRFASEEGSETLADILEESKAYDLQDTHSASTTSDLESMTQNSVGRAIRNVLEDESQGTSASSLRPSPSSSVSPDSRSTNAGSTKDELLRPTAAQPEVEEPPTDHGSEQKGAPSRSPSQNNSSSSPEGFLHLGSAQKSEPSQTNTSPEGFPQADFESSPDESSGAAGSVTGHSQTNLARTGLIETPGSVEEVVCVTALQAKGSTNDRAESTLPVDRDIFEAEVKSYAFDMKHDDIELSPHSKRASPVKRKSPDLSSSEESVRHDKSPNKKNRHVFDSDGLLSTEKSPLSPGKVATENVSPQLAPTGYVLRHSLVQAPTSSSPVRPTSPEDSLGLIPCPPSKDSSSHSPNKTKTPDHSGISFTGGGNTSPTKPPSPDSLSDDSSTMRFETSKNHNDGGTSVATSYTGHSHGTFRPKRRHSSLRVTDPPHPLCSLIRLEEIIRRRALKGAKKKQKKQKKKGRAAGGGKAVSHQAISSSTARRRLKF
jgi:hypothetical protein